MDRRYGWAACLWLVMATGGVADEVRFDSQAQWAAWELPLGAVERTSDGLIRPVKTRKNSNAARDAAAFGGDIRLAGSNGDQASLVLDGDTRTGWRPAPDAGPRERFIEVDLGRVVSAHRVHLIFAEDGPPFEIFDLLLSTGEQFRDDAREPIDGTVTYRIRQRFTENNRRRITYQLDPGDAFPVHFVRVEVLKAAAQARLVEIEVEAFGDNLIQGIIERGGRVGVVVGVDSKDAKVSSLANVLQMVDGRISTRWSNIRATRAENDVVAQMTFDLGAVYRVDHVRQIAFSAASRGFWFNFYEVLTSDGSLAPDGSLRWIKHFSGWGEPINRQQGMADHLFTPTPVRYLQVRWKAWDANCGDELGDETARGCAANGTTSEMQVFGEGFPVQADLRSPIIDLQGQKNINALHWRADSPPGSRVELRSRSGNTLTNTVVFHDKNAKVITQRQWERLIPSFRGPVDTTSTPGGDWSAWSTVYAHSGRRFLSPSMRRYVQLEARLISDDPQVAAVLDAVTLDFSEPLAQAVSAEIFPIEVEPGVMQSFTYFIRPQRTLGGFDRLIVEASTALDFSGLRLDGEPLEVRLEPRAQGFAVELPRRVRTGQLIEMDFAAAVFVNGTRFDLFLEDSQLTEPVRQQVEAGDATEQVESSTNIVQLPLGQGLYANLQMQQRVLTPNGDGVNDQLVIDLDLINLLEDRPLRLTILNLAGWRMYQVELLGKAGRQDLLWDGRDATGNLVPPGNYIVRLQIDGDARSQVFTRVLPVAY